MLKLWKRSISFLLSACMVLEMMPGITLPAFAEQDGEPETVMLENVFAQEEAYASEAEELPGETESEPENVYTVRFVCDPAEAYVCLEQIMNENQHVMVEPEWNGEYRLLPGIYVYSVSCDGYEPVVEQKLVLSGSNAEPVVLQISLVGLPVEMEPEDETAAPEETEAPTEEEVPEVSEAPSEEATEAPGEEIIAPVTEENVEPAVEETEPIVQEDTTEPASEETEAPTEENTVAPAIEETEAPVEEAAEPEPETESVETVIEEEPTEAAPVEEATEPETEEEPADTVIEAAPSEPEEEPTEPVAEVEPVDEKVPAVEEKTEPEDEEILEEEEPAVVGDGSPAVQDAELLGSGQCGDSVNWELNSDGVLRIFGEGEMWDYDWYDRLTGTLHDQIKSVVISEGVTSIGEYAFYDCTGLTELVLPESLTSIGEYAFSYCSGLTELVLPEGLTSIGEYAFYNCDGLMELVLPGSLKSIGGSAFHYCSGLTELVLPESLTSIGEYAFSYCSGLTELVIPEGWTSIGEYAFSSCSGLTKLVLPEGLTSIGNGAFSGCSGLTELVLPESLTSIGEYAFYDCSGLTKLVLPEGLTNIGGCAFYDCTGLTELVLPESLTSIGENAFSYCSGLTELVLPEGLTSIENGAFYVCSGLTKLVLPESLTNIGGSAFSWCSGLTELVLPEGLTSIGDSAFYDCDGLTELVLPEGLTSIGGRAFYDCTGLTELVLPESLTSIGEDAFSYCSGLTELVLPEGLTSIGNGAFSGCSGLTELVLPEGLTNIGYGAFSGCSGLTELVLPESLTSIGGSAFSGCSGLTKLVLPESLTNIGGSAFSGCSGLTKLVLPESLTSIGGSAFYGCSGLTELVLPESLTSIGKYAFSYCSGLTELVLPESLTSIGENAFSGCSGLTELVLPEGLTSIENSAFSDCSGLTKLVLPESLTSIGGSAFYGCSGLTELVLPESLTSIGSGAFYGCSGLTELVLPEGLTSIENSAFSDCSGLTELVLPKSLTGIEHYAFSYCSGLTELVLPEGLTSIGNFAFGGCSGLTELVLPEGLTSIGEYAFYDCSGLTELVLPEGLTWIAYYTFDGCSGLTKLVLPEGVTSIGNFAFEGCSGLTELVIPESLREVDYYAFYGIAEDVTFYVIPGSWFEEYAESMGYHVEYYTSTKTVITVSFPDAAELAGGKLSLSNGTQKITRALSAEPEYRFDAVTVGETYTLEVQNANGDILYRYQFTAEANAVISLENVEIGKMVALQLLTPEGKRISSGYTLSWLDEDGRIYSSEPTLKHVPAGKVLTARIELQSSLAKLYRLPEAVVLTAGVDSVKTVTLQAFRMFSFTGSVMENDAPIAGASVILKQELNGFAVSAAAVTDATGTFTAEIYDLPVEVTVSAAGFTGVSTSLDTPADGMEPVLLHRVSGCQIGLNMTYRRNTGEQERQSDLSLGNLTVKNLTTGEDVYDYSLSGTILTFPENVQAGDRVQLTVSSVSGRFADVTTEVTAGRLVMAELELVEYGTVEITGIARGNIRVMLFDSTGKRIQSAVLEKKGSVRSGILADGSYTAVLIDQSDLLVYPAEQKGLADMELQEGKDYVSLAVQAVAGKCTSYEAPAVPNLDATRFYFTDISKTYLTSNKTVVTAGSRFTVSASTEFLPEYASAVSDIRWIFDYGQSCDYVPGTLSVGKEIAENVSFEAGRISVGVASPAERVRLCLLPVASGAVQILVSLEFTLKGRTIRQPVGEVAVKADAISLDVPEFTMNSHVTASGTAPAKSVVSVYDNDVLVGQTETKSSGKWSVDFDLYKPYANSEHTIYAMIKLTSGSTIRTESRTLDYSYSANPAQVSKVTMYNICDQGQNVIVFDFVDPNAASPSSYRFWPGAYPLFTFVTEFTEGTDMEKLSNVQLHITLSNGEEVSVDAQLNEETGKFVSTLNVGSYAPVNVSVSYQYENENYFSTEEMSEVSAELEQAFEDLDIETDIGMLFEENLYAELIDISSFEDTLPDELIAEIEEYNSIAAEYNAAVDDLQAQKENFEVVKSYCEEVYEHREEILPKYEIKDNGISAAYAGALVEATVADCPTFDLSDAATRQWIENENVLVSFASDDDNSIILVHVQHDEETGAVAMTMYYPENELPVSRARGESVEFYGLEIASASSTAAQPMLKGKQLSISAAPAATAPVDKDALQAFTDSGTIANTAATAIELAARGTEKYANKLKGFCETLSANIEKGHYGNLSKPVKSGILQTAKTGTKIGTATVKGSSALVAGFGGSFAGKLIPGLGLVVGCISAGSDIQKIFNLNWDMPLYAIAQTLNLLADVAINLFAALLSGLMLAAVLLGVKVAAGVAIAVAVISLLCAGASWVLQWDYDQITDVYEKKLKEKAKQDSKQPIVDPSGYIYEAVPSNRVADATVTCEQQVTKYDMYDEEYTVIEVWDAAPYEQQNPVLSLSTGEYGWDVPDGVWRVRAEKDGYTSAYSEWMNVPPPQLDVNLGLVNYDAPVITDVVATENRVDITLSRYLTMDSITPDVLSIRVNGSVLSGCVETLNAEAAPNGEIYASRIRFTPDAQLHANDSLTAVLNDSAVSYAGTPADGNSAMTVQVASEITALTVDALSMTYNSDGVLTVHAQPAASAAGRWITLKPSSDFFVSLPENRVQLDANGCAEVAVHALLPGEEIIRVQVEGTDAVADASVVIQMKVSMLDTPELVGTSIKRDGINLSWNAVENASMYRVLYRVENGEWMPAIDTVETSATVIGLTSGQRYSFTVCCISEDGSIERSKYDPDGLSEVFLAAPAVSAVSNTSTGVKVTWGAVEGAENYRVMYKTSGGSWKTAGTTTGTSYTVKGLTSGTKYYFTARCVNADNSKTTSSYNSTGKSITYIAAPSVSAVSNTTTGVKVTWGSVKGAVNYRVMYKTSGGSWKTAGTTTGTSFTVKGLKSGTKYYFTVRCVNADNSKTTSSYNSTGKSITYIAAPSVSAVSNTTTGVKVTWGSVKGAVNYRVMYKTSSGSWKTAGTTAGTSYTVKGLKSGTKYYFTVRCVNADNSKTTSSYNSTGKSITYIAAPSVSAVSNTTSGVKVTWGSVKGAVNYRVMYKTSSGSWKTAGTTTGTSLTVKGLKSGTKYYFTVVCVNKDNSKTTSAYNTTGKSITYIAAPALPTVSNSKSGVKVTWTAVSGAAKYRVMYKTSGGSWKSAGSTTGTSLTVKNLKSGTKYYFTVVCVNKDNTSMTSAYNTTGKALTVK